MEIKKILVEEKKEKAGKHKKKGGNGMSKKGKGEEGREGRYIMDNVEGDEKGRKREEISNGRQEGKGGKGMLSTHPSPSA